VPTAGRPVPARRAPVVELVDMSRLHQTPEAKREVSGMEPLREPPLAMRVE